MESWEAQHRVFTKMMLNWHICHKCTLPNVCRIQHIQGTFRRSILCTFFSVDIIRYMTNLDLSKVSSNLSSLFLVWSYPFAFTSLFLFRTSCLRLRKLMSHSNVNIFFKLKLVHGCSKPEIARWWYLIKMQYCFLFTVCVQAVPWCCPRLQGWAALWGHALSCLQVIWVSLQAWQGSSLQQDPSPS